MIKQMKWSYMYKNRKISRMILIERVSCKTITSLDNIKKFAEIIKIQSFCICWYDGMHMRIVK